MLIFKITLHTTKISDGHKRKFQKIMQIYTKQNQLEKQN